MQPISKRLLFQVIALATSGRGTRFAMKGARAAQPKVRAMPFSNSSPSINGISGPNGGGALAPNKIATPRTPRAAAASRPVFCTAAGLPRKQRQPDRGQQAQKLRHHDHPAAIETVRHLPGRQGEKDHRERAGEAREPERGRGARPLKDLVLHCHGEHLPADHRDEIARRIERVAPVAKRRVRVACGRHLGGMMFLVKDGH